MSIHRQNADLRGLIRTQASPDTWLDALGPLLIALCVVGLITFAQWRDARDAEQLHQAMAAKQQRLAKNADCQVEAVVMAGADARKGARP